MRIRKNAKLSPLLLGSGSGGSSSAPVVETYQSHVCQLNKSPWDVIPFDSDSIQFEPDYSFTAGNGSVGDSVGAVESVASMMDAEEKLAMMMVVDDNHEAKVVNDNGDKGIIACCRGWQCKNGAKQGQQFCEHHLSLGSSYSNTTTSSAKNAAGARRGRARAAKKTSSATSSSSNPYEFYYYSGFGPLWGKRRGDRNGGEGKRNNNAAENSNVTESVNVVTDIDMGSVGVDIINEVLDYVDIDDEDEYGNNIDDQSGKKRMRKPVKARSLKSLM